LKSRSGRAEVDEGGKPAAAPGISIFIFLQLIIGTHAFPARVAAEQQ
jgi:hypothetical protein